MAITINHSTPADGSFSASGAIAWNANHSLIGAGTMAEQDASNVTITGGSIDNVFIGASIASTGAFTTLVATSGIGGGAF